MSSARAKILEKNDDDVVIVSAIRSALTKSKKGGFKDTRPEEILMNVLKHTYTSTNLDPTLIEDIAVGNVLPPSGGASIARMASIAAGIPIETPISTVNRQCASGLTAVNQIANSIKCGQIDIGIGAGVESMTFSFGPAAIPDGFSETVCKTQEAAHCLIPMGITSENIAADYNISREAQDTFAALSSQKAAAAQKAKLFEPEILPIQVKQVSPDRETKTILVDHDDGVRDGVTVESLSKLKPAFKKDGSTTAGNASQVTDGAAAVLLARRSVAKRLGLPIIGKFVSVQAVGVPPRIMGVGPAYAIPLLLKKTGLEMSDIDFFEINEAFASQALWSCEKLGLPWNEPGLHGKVNRWGGAIALGHPLGCTGARLIATGLNIAKHDNEKVFVMSMGNFSGMGVAGLFVNEQ
ncbi:acetyl-CoA acetyl transferase [Lentinula detonsa]|uniref:Acetyl-CoA acetyl transferase n=1 Tax=Lentinula detonsa TaxID=2804962 RepID=A0A9W8NTF1_9AGAR|nr:acetyl-CoA acetyl transferase [Lentinula detonsa]KAJ3985444.1 acetyl-CoA acetyl transferase [Lentinula detonsa]